MRRYSIDGFSLQDLERLESKRLIRKTTYMVGVIYTTDFPMKCQEVASNELKFYDSKTTKLECLRVRNGKITTD